MPHDPTDRHSHRGQTRQHFVTTIIENLDGVDFVHRRTMRIRNRYDAEVPTVIGAVAHGKLQALAADAAIVRAELGWA